VIIKAFELEEYEAVIALWKNAGLHLNSSDSRQALEQALERDADLFLVAVEGDDLVGAVLGRYDGRRGWINHLAVAQRYRAKDVGSQLMQEVERRLRAKRCEKVSLFIEPANAGVGAFYEQLGYEQRELLLMQKQLVPLAEEPNAAIQADLK
jgi:ribosomal protein S18 acetylase RimI-like enzyme